MSLPTLTQLNQLKDFKAYPCLSIYTPFIKPNSYKNPNKTEVNNMLKQARISLESNDVDEKFIRRTIDPVKEFLNTKEQLASREGGIVIFSHPDFFCSYHIPQDSIPYLITVQQGFNVEPLIDLQKNNRHYFLLCLGHKHVRLYKGDRYEITEVKVRSFPSSMIEALNIDEFPKSRETHAVTPASMGKGSEGFHQQFNVAETDKKMLKEFLRRVDHAVCRHLVNHHEPLVLSGVSYIASMYESINNYPNLAEVSIPGNQDVTEVQVLRDKAWNIVKDL